MNYFNGMLVTIGILSLSQSSLAGEFTYSKAKLGRICENEYDRNTAFYHRLRIDMDASRANGYAISYTEKKSLKESKEVMDGKLMNLVELASIEFNANKFNSEGKKADYVRASLLLECKKNIFKQKYIQREVIALKEIEIPGEDDTEEVNDVVFTKKYDVKALNYQEAQSSDETKIYELKIVGENNGETIDLTVPFQVSVFANITFDNREGTNRVSAELDQRKPDRIPKDEYYIRAKNVLMDFGEVYAEYDYNSDDDDERLFFFKDIGVVPGANLNGVSMGRKGELPYLTNDILGPTHFTSVAYRELMKKYRAEIPEERDFYERLLNPENDEDLYRYVDGEEQVNYNGMNFYGVSFNSKTGKFFIETISGMLK